MLVCVFLCTYCTRDRGCSAHPAFPAPSFLKRVKPKQPSGISCREKAASYSFVIAREGGRSSIPETLMIEPIGRSVLDTPHARGMTAFDAVPPSHTGSAMEYFTWLSTNLDSIEAMPSSRVSLFFRNASYDDRSAATTRKRESRFPVIR